LDSTPRCSWPTSAGTPASSALCASWPVARDARSGSQQLGLPLANHLVTKDEEGKERPLARDKFYVPGSVLRVRVDPAHRLAWGLGEEVDVMFSSSPTFRLPDGAAKDGLARVAWFDRKAPLRSGWAWGQERLEGGVAVAEARLGKGRLALFGPEILFRAQPHGTFKFLFNGITRAGTAEWARDLLRPALPRYNPLRSMQSLPPRHPSIPEGEAACRFGCLADCYRVVTFRVCQLW
jgi:hypothetical protein